MLKENKEKLILVLINWFIGIFFALSGGATFLVNDSPLMKGYVSGEYTGDPVPNLIYSSGFLAIPLASLYELFPSFAWYSWLLLATTLLATTTVIVASASKLELYGWSAFLIPWTALMSVRPDYTGTALVGVAIAITSYFMFQRYQSSTAKYLGTLLSLVLIVVAMSWRPAAGLVAVAVLAPVFVIVALALRRVVFLAWPILTAVAGYLMYSLLDGRGPTEWSAWLQFNALRGDLHSSRTELLEKYAVDVGWSDSQAYAFYSFVYPDEQPFTLSGLQELNEVLPRMTALPADNLFGILQLGLMDVLSYWPLWLLALLAFAVPKIIALYRFPAIIPIIGTLLLYWTFLVLTIRYVRLPDHLHVPLVVTMLIGVGLSLTVWNPSSVRNDDLTFMRKGWVAILFVLSLVTALFLPPYELIDRYQQGKQNNSQSQDVINSLASFDACRVFVSTWALSPTALAEPYKFNKYWSAPVLELGWGAMSPAWYERKSRLEIEGSVVTALGNQNLELYQQGVCFIGSEIHAATYQDLLNDYVGTFTPIRVGEIDSPMLKIPVWRFVKTDTP